MAVFEISSTICKKCGKEWKTLGGLGEIDIVRRCEILSICEDCKKDLIKLVEEFLDENKE